MEIYISWSMTTNIMGQINIYIFIYAEHELWFKIAPYAGQLVDANRT